MGFSIRAPVYQSQDIGFREWISLLTLCLAPLVAHLFAGAPRPSILTPVRPRWHDYVCVFNPTAIIYRYAAIVERRIRAYQWEPIDVAAANAIFWTGRGWEGSEQLVIESMPYCTLLPEGTTIRPFSIEMLKTIITTMQGVQAIASLTGSLANPSSSVAVSAQPGMDFIFGPLSMLGLLRLFASPWLVDDFSYTVRTVNLSDDTPDMTEMVIQRHSSLDSLLQGQNDRARYRPISYWPCRLFQLIYMAILFGFCFLTASYCFMANILLKAALEDTHIWFTTTTYSVALFYFITFSVTLLTYTWYAVRGRTTSSLPPCASHPWFKAWSCLWLLLATALITISALETCRTICGSYTSAPAGLADYDCGYSEVVRVNPNSTLASSTKIFGLASQYSNGSQLEDGRSLEGGEFWALNFTGLCLGDFVTAKGLTRAKTIETANYSQVFPTGDITMPV